MDPNLAHSIARRVHAGQLNRFGEPVIDHVERIARAVPENVQAIAYLHDVLERSGMTVAELHEQGLTEFEGAVLRLLTRPANEPYERYVARIAKARGCAGRVARVIKLADLDDHLGQGITPDAPNYAWARAKIQDLERNGSRLAAKSRRAGAAA